VHDTFFRTSVEADLLFGLFNFGAIVDRLDSRRVRGYFLSKHTTPENFANSVLDRFLDNVGVHPAPGAALPLQGIPSAAPIKTSVMGRTPGDSETAGTPQQTCE
jgi:hypothetical protein